MRFIEVEQRSDEWLELRRSKIGASDCPSILGTPSERKRLFRQKILGEEVFVTPAMMTGRDYEPVALEAYNSRGVRFTPAVVQHPERDYMIASLDGINHDRTAILEIKIVGAKTWLGCMNVEIPKKWVWQIQHQLECVPTAQIAFLWMCYLNGDEIAGQEFVVKRDPFMIKQLLAAEEDFYFNHMLRFKEPEGKWMSPA